MGRSLGCNFNFDYVRVWIACCTCTRMVKTYETLIFAEIFVIKTTCLLMFQPVKYVFKSFSFITIEMNQQNRGKVYMKQSVSIILYQFNRKMTFTIQIWFDPT